MINNFRWQEIVLSILALIWGGILLLPGDLFAAVKRYQFLAYYMPDYAWGAILVLCGFVCLLAKPTLFRKEAHFGLFFVWGFITVLALLSGITLAALLVALPFASIGLLHAQNFFSLRRNVPQEKQENS